MNIKIAFPVELFFAMRALELVLTTRHPCAVPATSASKSKCRPPMCRSRPRCSRSSRTEATSNAPPAPTDSFSVDSTWMVSCTRSMVPFRSCRFISSRNRASCAVSRSPQIVCSDRSPRAPASPKAPLDSSAFST